MLTSFATALGVAIDQLRVNTLRTLLSTLGVIIGVGSLVAVLSLGDGMERFMREQVERTTPVQTVTLSSRTVEEIDGAWVPVRDYPVFGPDDAAAITREVEWVKDVALSAAATVPVESPRSGGRRETTVTAAMAGLDIFLRSELSAGRFFTRVEDERNAAVVVLSNKLARDLAGARAPERIIGETVRVNGVPREVIGILAPYTGERGYGAVVPYSSSGALVTAGTRRLRPSISVRATRVEDVDALRRSLEDWLGKRYGRWERRVELVTQEKAPRTDDAGGAHLQVLHGCHHRYFAVGRRDRDHECHAGLGHRADAGDRRAQGARREGTRRAAAVPVGVGRHLQRWERYRGRAWGGDRRGRYSRHSSTNGRQRIGTEPHRVVDAGGGGVSAGRRVDLRHVSGVAGRATVAD